jgi:hypothetical protein
MTGSASEGAVGIVDAVESAMESVRAKMKLESFILRKCRDGCWLLKLYRREVLKVKRIG